MNNPLKEQGLSKENLKYLLDFKQKYDASQIEKDKLIEVVGKIEDIKTEIQEGGKKYRKKTYGGNNTNNTDNNNPGVDGNSELVSALNHAANDEKKELNNYEKQKIDALSNFMQTVETLSNDGSLTQQFTEKDFIKIDTIKMKKDLVGDIIDIVINAIPDVVFENMNPDEIVHNDKDFETRLKEKCVDIKKRIGGGSNVEITGIGTNLFRIPVLGLFLFVAIEFTGTILTLGYFNDICDDYFGEPFSRRSTYGGNKKKYSRKAKKMKTKRRY
jgi:hypothetical protein